MDELGMSTLYHHKIYCLGGTPGQTTSITNVGATTVDVDANVIANAKVGSVITLSNGGSTSQDLSVTEINGQTLTVHEGVDQTFASGSNLNVLGHWSYLWKSDEVPISTCPDNPAHAVNPDSASIVEIREPQEVYIIQTMGMKDRTKAVHSVVDVGANSTVVRNFTWDADISIVGLRIFIENRQDGDTVDIAVNQGYAPGKVGAAVSPGATQITVDPVALGYIGVEDHITLSEGATTNVLGLVTAIDDANSRITVSSATTNSFTVAADVQVTKYLAKDLPIPSSVGKLTVGDETIEGIETPKGAVYTFTYRNVDLLLPSKYIMYIIYAIGRT